MKEAETFARPRGNFFVLILPTQFFLLPWALPSWDMYPLTTLPLENKSERAAPSLCQTGACLIIKTLARGAGILFLRWHCKGESVCRPYIPTAQRRRQGCCFCLPRACRASLVWSKQDPWPDPSTQPAQAAACCCTSNSTSVREQRLMLGNAWWHT